MPVLEHVPCGGLRVCVFFTCVCAHAPCAWVCTRHPTQAQCYAKVVALAAGVDPRQPVLGLHVFGPSAGEVLQGYAVAMRLGLTMQALWGTVGLHPTHAEEIVGLDTSKRSGAKVRNQCCVWCDGKPQHVGSVF